MNSKRSARRSQASRDYRANSSPNKGSEIADASIAETKTRELDPSGIWVEKGREYKASYEELRIRFSACLVEVYRPLWNKVTRYKIAWFLSRQAGLIAWSDKEAQRRLRPNRQRFYTFRQWQEMHLLDSIKISADEFKDPHWHEFFETLRTEGGLDALRRLLDKAEIKRWKPSGIERLFCCWWDRLSIPLEFWTYPSMAVFLNELLMRKDRNEIISENQLRQWVSRLHLNKTARPVVLELTQSGSKIDQAAASFHGLPPDMAVSDSGAKQYDEDRSAIRLKFEQDFLRQKLPFQVTRVYKDRNGAWICDTSDGRSWRWDD